MDTFVQLLGDTLIRGGADGGEVPTADALKGATTVAVYASAHCPSRFCRAMFQIERGTFHS